MTEEKDILVVDDEPIIRDILIRKLTSSGYKPVAVENAFEALKHGASDYLIKPFNLEEIVISVQNALEKRRLILENRGYQEHLEEIVKAQTAEIRGLLSVEQQKTAELNKALAEIEVTYNTTLEALSTALDYRDSATEGHSQRVVQYSIEVGKALGLSRNELQNLARGTLLHDIGKIGVPDSVLRKPANLTTEEWVQMRKHVEYGFSMLKGIPFLKDASFLVLHHQEKYDGTGYPQGLKREQIVMGARIFALADTYDSMTTDRPYRKALPDRDARKEILRCRSSQFDPVVVDTFFKIPEDRWFKIKEDVAGMKVDNSVFRNPAPAYGNEKDPIPLMLL